MHEALYFTVFDLHSGETVQRLQPEDLSPWHSLVAVRENLLIIQYFENKKNPDNVSFSALDWRNGNWSEYSGKYASSTVHIPEIFPVDSPGFQTMKQYIGKELVLGGEYLELDDLLLLTYYLPNAQTFKRHLMIIRNGTTVYHERQDTKMTGFAPGSFFTFRNRLIFARENNEINIYEI